MIVRSRSASGNSQRSPSKLSSRSTSRNKFRLKKQDSFDSRSPSPTKEASEQNGSVHVTKTVLSQQMKSILQTPKKEAKSKDSKKYQNRNKIEGEQNSGIFDAVEETIENIFQ